MLLNAGKKVPVIGLVSVFIFSLWAILVLRLAPQFQNTADTDPLAMINVLFPFFWIILLAFVGVCFAAFVQSDSPRWLHMLLLGQFSLMLYFTPFLLSGFSWSPDSLWHGGVASYMPEVLSGGTVALSNYAQAYPFSFLTTYLVERVFGISVFTYTLYIYPIICTVLFSVLAYFFASRIFGPKAAFLAMLFTLPALHYVEMHVSPFSAGTIILLLPLILLTFESRLARVLSFLSIIVLVLVHPISPIMLGVYFFSVVVVGFLFRRRARTEAGAPAFSVLPYFLFISIVWFSWTAFYAMSVYLGVQIAIASIFDFGFLTRLFYASDFAVGGAGFIYPWIHELSLVIYGLFLVLILLPGFKDVRRFIGKKLDAAMYKRVSLSLASIIFAAMGFLLFLSSGERFLLGRGLLFFIFMGSMVIATYFVDQAPRWKRAKTILALSLVVFLVCTFPVVSYSKEAYNTFTPSANAGLSFLSSKVDLSQLSLSMSSSQQLASYVNLSEGLNLQSFPPSLNSSNSEVIAMRINGYFLISMRSDLSFTNNSFTRLSSYLDEEPGYNKIYSNARFEVYARSP